MLTEMRFKDVRNFGKDPNLLLSPRDGKFYVEGAPKPFSTHAEALLYICELVQAKELMPICPECGEEFSWFTGEKYPYTAWATERGWKCSSCDHRPGEPDGYSPFLDRTLIGAKVECIQFELAGEFGGRPLIGYSNSSHGAGVLGEVVQRCEQRGFYDQKSIIAFLMLANQGSSAKFWADRGEKILAGNDPRTRCNHPDCNELATVFSNTNTCSAHGTWGRDLKQTP